MSWIRARAYKDSRFLLERLLSQVASDVHEFNKLPSSTRRGLTFTLHRDGRDTFLVKCPYDSVRFIAGIHEVSVIRGPLRTCVEVKANWDAKERSERWLLVENPDKPLTLEELSKCLLESFFFGDSS